MLIVRSLSSDLKLWSWQRAAGSRWGEAPGTGHSVGHRECLRQEWSPQEPVRTLASPLWRWSGPCATDEDM